jgi:glycosyltransferase involved in cell wall biosynthesis
MKILIYSPRFYPLVGGLENLTLSLAKEWKKLGHEVKVISSAKPDGTECGIEVLYSPHYFKQIKLFIQSDVFYMPNLSLKGIWLLLLNPFKKWVISHNVWYNGYNLHTKLAAKLKLFLLNFCKNISVSKAVADSLPVRSEIIHNGYDNEIFYNQTLEKKKDSLLFVGRLVSDKGIDTLLHAFIELKKTNINLTLTIVGEGEEREWIQEFINTNNLNSSVELKGKQVGNDLASCMNIHSILVVPSKWAEPFGIVALEGLACGCKVVCSSGGGLPEAVGKFGYLFSNGNTDELINTIKIALVENNSTLNRELDDFLLQHQIVFVAKKYLEIFN